MSAAANQTWANRQVIMALAAQALLEALESRLPKILFPTQPPAPPPGTARPIPFLHQRGGLGEENLHAVESQDAQSRSQPCRMTLSRPLRTLNPLWAIGSSISSKRDSAF